MHQNSPSGFTAIKVRSTPPFTPAAAITLEGTAGPCASREEVKFPLGLEDMMEATAKQAIPPKAKLYPIDLLLKLK